MIYREPGARQVLVHATSSIQQLQWCTYIYFGVGHAVMYYL
jgi:hypothetical protein